MREGPGRREPEEGRRGVNGRRAFLGSRATYGRPNWSLTSGFGWFGVSHPSARYETVTDARSGRTSGATPPPGLRWEVIPFTRCHG